MSLLPRIFREPLVLFGLTAAVVFALHSLTTPQNGAVIKVTREVIDGLVDERAQLIGRPLSSEERVEVTEELIRQEILVREAAARQFHLHDSKTRKRMVTQMYFVMAEDAPAPSQADLAALVDADPDRYSLPKSVTFKHVFFENDKTAAQALKDRIDAGQQMPEEAGDRFWLGSRMENYTPSQILTVLGHQFAGALPKLEPGIWTGPIRSGRGWHIVKLEAFHPPQPLPAVDMDRLLREDWKEAWRAKTFEARLDEMRKNYRIVMPAEAQAPLKTAQVAKLGGD